MRPPINGGAKERSDTARFYGRSAWAPPLTIVKRTTDGIGERGGGGGGRVVCVPLWCA